MKPDHPLTQLHQLILSGAPICTDSRKVVSGAVYFALKGDNFDGNDFASDALDKGCSLAVVDDPKVAVSSRFVLVGNALDTLQSLSHLYRRQFNFPVIGITGTNGKTTTKELTHAVLSAAFNTLATSGNLNNHIGVPLTLLALSPHTEMAVVEMGANHMNEISALCRLADPGYGIITNIGKAHLEGFGSAENVIAAKSELYHHVGNRNGILFVNGDNDLLCKLSKKIQSVFYGTGEQNHCRGAITSSHPFLHVSFSVNKSFGKALTGTTGQVRSRLTGTYNFENIMAAVTAGLYFGVPVRAIEAAIEAYIPANNRSQLIHTTHNTVVLDSYNANPGSMAASINHFAHFRKEGKTALLLGDMLELGSYAKEEHKAIAALADSLAFDLMVFIGPCFSDAIETTGNRLAFKEISEAISWIKQHPLRDHTVLVKGSRGIRMESFLEYL